ncbi:hypothetical protein SEA_GODONK_183 [Gordonia phage GodonK]|uniref:Uncharacterized protein n=1 Tax=Gordonia phage GodonK TaxID=2562192 RepID=A0A4D6E2P1_9CAUD|nr:hypothetical protein HOV33_gp185 [Gordonia phage GodonK]QBZ72771.1 hypothetical protein SEA_GODONK_183 [Gordonia phage GodonK]
MRGLPQGVVRRRQLEVVTYGGRSIFGAFVRLDENDNLQVFDGRETLSVDLHDVEFIRQGPNSEED